MGIWGSITGFLGKVAEGVTHVIAPDVKWEPSSLLKQAGKLLPGLTDLIPGVGPLVSKGISAVESIFGGSHTQESTTEAVLPDLNDVKALIKESSAAISDTKIALKKRLDELQTHLSAELDTLGEAVAKDIAELNAEIKKTEENNKVRRGDDKREEELKEVHVAYEKHEVDIRHAIDWWNDHVERLHSFISYNENQEIKHYLGAEGRNTGELQLKYAKLKEAVQDLETYMTDHMPPTQEILDLYVLGVNWLLTYDKMMLTLRSYWAHSVFTSENADLMSGYMAIREAWVGDLEAAIRNAKHSADFILGDASGAPGFLEKLWERRHEDISSISSYKESERSRQVCFFTDEYPAYGVGWAKFPLTRWHYTIKKLILVQTGSRDNYEHDKEQVHELTVALNTGYLGVQSAYFEASTRVIRETAHRWRISADRWQHNAPPNVPNGPAVDIHIEAPSKEKQALEFAAKNGLDVHDAVRGPGYERGDKISYAVSYVTNHGEGRASGLAAPTLVKDKEVYHEYFTVHWEKCFISLRIKPVAFQIEHGDDLRGKAEARELDKDVLAHIVRRVYVKRNDGPLRHLIDISAPPHKEVHVWDLNGVGIRVEEKTVAPASGSVDDETPWSPDLFSGH